MSVERMGGFADLTGMEFGTVKVIRFAGRNPVRWEVVCQVPGCNSRWIEQHYKLTQGDYHCKNVSCQLGRVRAPRANQLESENERLRHEQTAAPLSVVVPALAKAKPVPPHPQLKDYQRLVAAQKLWGNKTWTFEDFNAVREFKPEFFEKVMSDVGAFEKQRELAAFADSLEAQEQEQFRRTYGV